MDGKEADKRGSPSGWLARLIGAALIVAALFFLIRALGPTTLGEQARRTLVHRLQTHYRHLDVSIQRGRYNPDVGLVFEGVRIADPSRSPGRGATGPMIRIERMIVVADVRPEKWFDPSSMVTTRRVVIEGLHADAWLEPGGEISLAQLLPLPKFGPACPRVEVHGADLRLIDPRGVRRPLEAKIAEALVLSKVNGDGKPVRNIRLTGATDFADEINIEVKSAGGQHHVQGLVKAARLSPQLFQQLPQQLQPLLADARDLNCVCDVQGDVLLTDDGPADYRIRTHVREGRFNHPSLPMPVSQLSGDLVCTPDGVEIEPLEGYLGEAFCRIEGTLSGHDWPCPADLRVSAKGLMLDERLAGVVSGKLRETWQRLRPFGRIDVEATLQHRQGDWRTRAALTCKGVDVRYEKFPYPVDDLVGQVIIRDGLAKSRSLHGRIGGRTLRCAFQVPVRPEAGSAKRLAFDTDGPVAIDNTLIDALTPRGESQTELESFVRSLQPRGLLYVTSAVFETDAAGRRRRALDLHVVEGHMRYEKFAYPLYNVNGRIRIEDGTVHVIGFKATNANAGVVRCHGMYRLPPKSAADEDGETPTAYQISDAVVSRLDGPRLELRFQASNVPMDEALRSSLPKPAQHVWDALSPGGVLDELEVAVSHDGAGEPLDLAIQAAQVDSDQITNRTLSLRPASLPYRLDITGGSVFYDGSKVTIESLRGRHDASHLLADGSCVQNDSGRWVLSLELRSGSRLHPDAELIDALPEQMNEAMRRLQLRGPVSVRGNTEVLLSDAEHPEPTIRWDVVLQLEGNRIGDVGPVHALRGEVSAKGTRDPHHLVAGGEVRIDSMHVYDLQITGIRGPYSIEDDHLRLGAATIAPGTAASKLAAFDHKQPIQGHVFDGTIDLDGKMIMSSGNFDVALAISEAKVPTLLADLGHTGHDITGTFTGQTELEGKLGASDLLKGTGTAKITGANLYQLPLIVQVFNQLRVTPTEDVAFTDGDFEFTIFGDQITFSELRLWGELVALHGGGTMTRHRELDLTFNTRVSPQNVFTQLLGPLRDTRYTLWTVDVKGPLYSPTIERRALDGVGKTLERWFPGVAPQPAAEPDSEAAAARFGNWFR